MKYRINRPDLGKERIAQPISARSSRHQSGNVNKFDRRRHNPGALAQPAEAIQPNVRNGNDAPVCLDSAERIVARSDGRTAKCIKQRRFTDVGQAYYSTRNGHAALLLAGRTMTTGLIRSLSLSALLLCSASWAQPNLQTGLGAWPGAGIQLVYVNVHSVYTVETAL